MHGEMIPLAEVCEINPRLPKNHLLTDDVGVSFVPMAAVDEHEGVVAINHIRPFGEVKKGYTSFRENDVLFAKITPCMENGKAAVVRALQGGYGFGSTEFHVLRATERVMPEWIFYFVRREQFRAEAKRNFTGTAGQQRVPASFLQSVAIPVPPLPEQRRIVDILSRAESIVRLRREAQKKAVELIPALFTDLFGDPATNPKGWRVAQIDDLCVVRTGATPHRDNSIFYENATVPWVKTGEVVGTRIRDTEEKISVAAIAATNCKEFPIDTLLVAMYGQGQTRGRVGILGIPAATNQACAAILPSDQIAHIYLFVLLQTQYERLRAMGRGGNQANLNLSMLKTFLVPVPPRALQTSFVQRYEQIDSIRSQQATATTQAEASFNALLAQVFAAA